ncbi:MAG: TIGR03013 family PEP-CTERM/XrtA system glycosyltransferase [Gammaproteobacteria bacterium]|nr:TIGR03013 family PEP-CTERM/XrtA system glycosyltransferase [Gammaproteobacteria bacterium]
MIRLFRHYISSAYLILILFEGLVYLTAIPVAYWVRLGMHLGWNNVFELKITSVIYAVVMLATAASLGLYQRSLSQNYSAQILRMLIVFVLASLIMAVVFYSFPGLFLGRGVLLGTILYSALGVTLVRYVFSSYVDTEAIQRRLLVLGAGEKAWEIEEYSKSNHHAGFKVIGYIASATENPLIDQQRIITVNNSLPKLAEQFDIDEVVIAYDDERSQIPVDDILACKMEGFGIIDSLTFFEKHRGEIRIDMVRPSWLYFSDGFRLDNFIRTIKRLIDLLASSVLLILFLPVMILIALAIALESRGKGSILYRQTRVGLAGQEFEILKFRSMLPNAEQGGQAQWAIQNDNRITALGNILRKYRLDELPQLVNVLRGEMSLVGPRPERPEFVEELSKQIPYYVERHQVKPGLTGWAQLNFSYGSSVDDARIKHQYDLYYLKNYSIFLDFLIMLQTVEVMLWKKGSR